MEDTNAKMTRGKKRTFMGHLEKVETWLLDVLRNPDAIEKNKDTDEIESSCSYVSDHFKEVIEYGMTFEKRIMIVIPMLNAIIRVYVVDKSGIITSKKYFQSIINVFTNALLQIREDILDDDTGSTTDVCDQRSMKFAKDTDLNECAENILDSLLTNFAKDDLLKKCLELFFSNKAIPSTDSNTTNEQCPLLDLTGPEALEKIMKCTADFASEAIIRSMDEFSKKYQCLMIVLREFVSDFFADTNDRSVHSPRMKIVDHILSRAWNWTDKTPLVLMFLKAGYAEAAIEWIKKLPSVGSKKELDEAVIAIVHNLSRHKDGLHTLRENHAFETLMEYKQSMNLGSLHKLDELDGLTQVLGMSLIGLATNDDDQNQNQELIRKVTEKLYDMCEEAPQYTDLRFKGYHLSDILDGLECAFANMSIVRHVLGNESNVKTERIKLFAELLTSIYGLSINQEADYLEKLIWKSSLNILLCISNYVEYRAELKNYGEFCILIEGLIKRPKQDIAKRIWCNLTLDKNPITPFHQRKTKQQPMICISYNWANEKFCKLFVEKLRIFEKIPIWVDYENVGWFEDKWDCVAPAIERATIIVVLVSNAYCDSIINFQELTYAMTLAKTQPQSETVSFIFVETEKGTADKREWISDLSKDRIILYNENKDQMVHAVLEHDTFLKKYTLVTNSAGISVQSHICTII